jgi:hypothetical protein
MAKIRILGWKKGLNTVHAIKEIRQRAGCSLAEAKAVVDRVFDNQEPIVEMSNHGTAAQLVDSLTAMGMPSVFLMTDYAWTDDELQDLSANVWEYGNQTVPWECNLIAESRL